MVPLAGLIEATVGAAAAVYVYAPTAVTSCASGFVTTTSTAPAVCAAVVAVSCVAPSNVTAVAAVPPKLTVPPLAKLVPVITTTVAPVELPLLGATSPIEGGAPR